MTRRTSQREPIIERATVARRNRRARWYALVVYLLLPLVAWGAVGLAAVTRRYVPPDTGDPLTDAVLDVLLSEYLSNPEIVKVSIIKEYSYVSYRFLGVPNESSAGISALYDQFASDPRYWQALAFLGSYPGNVERFSEQYVEYCRSIWEQALAHGATDSRLRQLMLEANGSKYYWDAYQAGEEGMLKGTSLTSDEQRKVFNSSYGYSSNAATEKKRANQEKQQWQLIQQHVDIEHPQLEQQLAELRELDGNESYPWYASTFPAFFRGDYELAKYYLQRGNEAENVFGRDWFMMDEAPKLAAEGEAIAAGLLSFTSGMISILNPICRVMTFEAVERRDGEMLDELLKYTWRGELSTHSLARYRVYAGATQINRIYELPVQPPASKEHGTFKQQLDELNSNYSLAYEWVNKVKSKEFGKDVTLVSTPQVLRDFLTFNESKRWHHLNYRAGKLRMGKKFQQQRAAIVREMQGFSYQELGWPEDAAPATADGGAGEAAAASDENATAGGGDAPAAAGGDV